MLALGIVYGLGFVAALCAAAHEIDSTRDAFHYLGLALGWPIVTLLLVVVLGGAALADVARAARGR
jgi:hypothetical protein